MSKYEAPQEVIDGLTDVRGHVQNALQALSQTAIGLDTNRFAETAASLRLIHDSLCGSTMTLDEHIRRYEPVAASPADLYDLADDPDSLLHALDGTDQFDRAKAPARSPELSALAMGHYVSAAAERDPSRQPSRSATVSRAAAKAARLMPAPRRI